MLFSHPPAECDHETEPVLSIAQLGLARQPLPIEIVVLDNQPRQALNDSDLQIVARDRSEQDNRGILALPAPQVPEPGIPEVSQRLR